MEASWLIDGTMNLTALCEREEWHYASVKRALNAAGLAQRDAEAFASFAFADLAPVIDEPPEELLTDEQYERLSLKFGE